MQQPPVTSASPLQSQPGRPWVQSAIVTLPLKAAAGASSGTRCDRYGSLSHGTNCPA
jgi:hypothetical protein